jgi:aquaporin-12
MAGLNVSLSFFFATCALCEAARRASKALLPTGAYVSFAREAAAAAQLAACYLEMQVLVEIGPWAGGFGPDLLLTLVFLLFLVHGATFDGASANPAVALQEFLMAEESLLSTLLKLVAQGLGVQTACALTQRCWALELSDMHLLQSLMFTHCSSALRTSVLHGALVEGACAFFFHLTLLHLRHSLPVYRVPALALLVTMMAYTGETFFALCWVYQDPKTHVDTQERSGPRGPHVLFLRPWQVEGVWWAEPRVLDVAFSLEDLHLQPVSGLADPSGPGPF